MRYVEKKTEKIRVPGEFRLPGTDIIVEAGDVLEIEFSEEEKKDSEKDDDEDEMDDEDEKEDKKK